MNTADSFTLIIKNLARAALITLGFVCSVWLLLNPSALFAAGAGCRTDPIIKLAGGKSLRLTAKIWTQAENVNSIEYTVHVPADAHVKRIVYTGGAFKDKETVTVLYDAAPDSYAAETLVHTQDTVKVIAYMQLRSKKDSETGKSDQVLPLLLEP